MPNPYFPAGVRGNEPEIAGFPPCARCGHDEDEHELVKVVWWDNPCVVVGCGCDGYYDEREEDLDPDRAYDERREYERGLE